MILPNVLIVIIISLKITQCSGCGCFSDPDPVHGNWGAWAPSVDYCEGMIRQDRNCDSPSPRHGGSYCDGDHMRMVDCDECSYNNGYCEHYCTNEYGYYTCSCRSGYIKDGKHVCRDLRCKTDNWPAPTNGQKTSSECQGGQTVSFGQNCYAKCHEGYTMTGSSSSQCGYYGVWTSGPPTCKAITCSSITVQDNMDVSPAECTSKPMSGTTCTISCKNGFSLVRYSASTHTTNCDKGTWTQGSSFYCRDLVKPVFTSCQNEDIVEIADKMKTKATATWTAIKAQDNDGDVPRISVYPSYLRTDTTSFEFPEGNHHVVFTANDNSDNTAQCSFKVTVKVIRCSSISSPLNGKTIPSLCTNLLGSKCTTECNDGYSINGSVAERECVRNGVLDTGKWTGVESTCERIKCSYLNEPKHTTRSGLGCSASNPVFRTSCTFECLPGYKAIAGSKTRVCKADGQWSGDDLKCQVVMCPALPQLSEGLSISNYSCIQNTLNYQDECRYTCGSGYLLLGPTKKSCTGSGQWSPAGNAYCKDISVPSFGSSCPLNIKTFADRHNWSVRVNWTAPTVTDNAQNKPVTTQQGKKPGDLFTAGHHTIMYTTTDRAGNKAQCSFQVIVEVIKCPVLTAPLRGSLQCSLSNVYGSQCQLSCNIGYSMKGSTVRTCERNGNQLQGKWTGNTTTCEAITCPSLDSPKHGYKSGCLTSSFGEKCLFYCNIGHKPVSGSASRTCLQNGTWTGSALVCKAVTCPALTAVAEVSISPSSCYSNPKYQTTCQYICQTGYRLIGWSIRTCLASGQWNYNKNVSCQDVERPRFTSPCPHNVDVFAKENMDSAEVVIPTMNATDNSGEVPTITITGLKHNYTEGKHGITVTATDTSGNKETCRFFIYVKILRCSAHSSYIINGKAVGKCDNTWGSICHFQCDHGFNITGSNSRTCKAKSGQIQGYWSGTMPFCTVNRCHPLTTPKNGYVYPPMCVARQGPVSDTSCLFGCYNGFEQSAGTRTITCGKNTRWDQDSSLIITCIDKTLPRFKESCPLDIRVPLQHNGLATANWTIPVAEDNTNILPTVTVQPSNAVPPFSVNTSTTVTYTARDDAGNVGRCSFRILIEDNIGPRVVYCPTNITCEATNLAEVVTWKTPEFADNSNVKITPKCNRYSGEKFYWGVWSIHCRGYDKNPHNVPAECSFTVTVKPKPCPPLNAPENGAKVCDIWMFGHFCTPMCNDKYDFAFAIPFGTIWACGARTGMWMPTSTLPDCSKIYVPGKAKRKASLLYYFSGDCHNATVQEQIKKQFIQIVNSSHFRAICTDPQLQDKCDVSNVEVTCGIQSADFSPPARRKRRSSDPDALKISFDISVVLHHGTNQTKQDIKSEVTNASKILTKLTSEIQTMADNGSLVLNVTDHSIVPVNGSFSTSTTSFTCSSGQIFENSQCISCPIGTYHNTSEQKCKHCSKGSYQNTEGQESCKRCPVGMSTLNKSSKNGSDCIAYCRPGYFSPTGLQPCFPCPKGSFQPFPGQINCTQCGNSTTTQTTGTASPGKCLVPCKPGSSSSSGFVPCRKCDKRSYQPHSEATSCSQCPGTTVTLNEGSTNGSHCIEINECLSNPCRAGSTCLDLVGDFACSCPNGYTGKRCENDIDDCASSPCQNNATCHDGLNRFSCTCLTGFTGSECETDIDECKQLPCLNNATCRDLIGRYQCYCQPGYDGLRCEREKNECLPNPCLSGGTCQDKFNAFSCQCVKGFRGSTCQENIDDCSPNPCNNSGQCVDKVNGYSCNCSDGYNGNNCETDIDECLSNPCKNNGTCYNEVGDFSCVCMNGYNGSTCEQEVNECLSDPCRNGGTCLNTVGSFSCRCAPGFQGDYCDIDVDECTSQPCANKATCTNTMGSFACGCMPGFTDQTCKTDINECLLSNPCANNGLCNDGLNSFVCHCLDGFSGPRCQNNIDDCAGKPCKNNATCEDGINDYTCRCSNGFTGKNCEAKIDHCASNPCENSGKCRSLHTDYKCGCIRGYTGKNCSTNINDCINNPCFNNGKCQDLVGSYRCSCLPGFTGTNCSQNIDDCKNHGCLSNGTCIDGINSYSCLCQNGTTGKHCEASVGPCDSFPCHNGGTCGDKDDQYFCSCPQGFTGQNCEVNIDDCKPVNPCQHKGVCTDLVSNYTCTCPQGVFGRNCENFTDHCLSANCSQHGSCINLPFGFKCNCSDGFYGPTCDHQVKKCMSSPCQNGARCRETSEGYNCSCTAGFTGAKCEINIDDCRHDKCLNNATCVDQVDGYLCLCQKGFNGTHCEHQLYSCKDNPCKNNGTCEDIFGGYQCKCPERYGGQRCEDDKSPCLVNPCLNAGSCTELNLSNFSCTCKPGFTGVTCETNIDDCATSPCPLHANCIDQVDGYKCQCHQSHTGTKCETPLGDNFDLVFKTKSRDNVVELLAGPTVVPDMKSFTIALWVKPDIQVKQGTIMTYMVPGNRSETLEISFTESHIRVMVKSDELKNTGNVNITDGKWHFIGLTWTRYHSKEFSIYFDGKIAATKRLESSGPPLKGGGKVVLGQRYSWDTMSYDVTLSSFVGVLHQVNFWYNVDADQEYMWNAAHSCSWPIDGNVYSWIAFLSGVKGGVLKKFPSTCKALDLCKQNCSHYTKCHKEKQLMVCTCQNGFTGKLCDININDCLSNPCKHGRCVDDIASYRCECNKGYYGNQCGHKLPDENKECPSLSKLPHGKVDRESYAGQHIADLKCNEGFSFRQHDVTRYACGLQTNWRWNNKEKITFPRCLSITEPITIRHKYHMSLPLQPSSCQTNQEFQQLKTSFTQAFLKSIESMPQHGCFAYGPCKVEEFIAPKCGGSRRTSRSAQKDLLINFVLLFKEWGNSSFDSTVTESSAAVAFQMKYAVTVGTFVMNLNGQTVRPRGTSLMLMSKFHQCKDGYVSSSDNASCVACPTGTYQSSDDCLPCPQGQYQDSEGQITCQKCPSGYATRTKSATDKDQCSKEKREGVPDLKLILLAVFAVIVVIIVAAIIVYCIWKRKRNPVEAKRISSTTTFKMATVPTVTENQFYIPTKDPIYEEIAANSADKQSSKLSNKNSNNKAKNDYENPPIKTSQLSSKVNNTSGITNNDVTHTNNKAYENVAMLDDVTHTNNKAYENPAMLDDVTHTNNKAYENPVMLDDVTRTNNKAYENPAMLDDVTRTNNTAYENVAILDKSSASSDTNTPNEGTNILFSLNNPVSSDVHV